MDKWIIFGWIMECVDYVVGYYICGLCGLCDELYGLFDVYYDVNKYGIEWNNCMEFGLPGFDVSLFFFACCLECVLCVVWVVM